MARGYRVLVTPSPPRPSKGANRSSTSFAHRPPEPFSWNRTRDRSLPSDQATELQELQERLRLRGAPGEESEVRGVVRRMAGVWRGSGRYVFEFREAH